MTTKQINFNLVIVDFPRSTQTFVKQMYEFFLTESLILAQDERWRRA